MKKRLRCLLLLVLLIGALTVSALADETINAAGFYDIGSKTNVTIEPMASSGTVQKTTADVDDKEETYETFFANSDKLSVALSGTTEGSQYLVLLVTGNALPTAANTICYIDQKEADSSGAVSFDVFPLLPEESGTMTLYITSNAADFETISVPLGYAVSGAYKVQPYTLGDVDQANGINASDASLVLQYLVSKADLSETQKLAADVDGKNGVNASDASYILQYLVNKITSFESLWGD